MLKIIGIAGMPWAVTVWVAQTPLFAGDCRQRRDALGPNVLAILLISVSMPSGGFCDHEDWMLIAELCRANDLLLILDTAMSGSFLR